MNISSTLKNNLALIKKRLTSDDVIFMPVTVLSSKGVLIFVTDVVDKNAIGKLVLEPLSSYSEKIDVDTLYNIFLSPEKKRVSTINDCIREIVTGNALFLLDGINEGFSFGFKKFEKRSITEPPTATVVKGPREGFVESLPVNISLMRRRIKSEKLHFENMMIGKYSQTPVSLCYLDGIVDKTLVKEVKSQLKKINIDAILDSSYVSKYLGNGKPSLFKQVGNTEKPDILTAKILEGRVAIFVDGSPIVLTVPYLIVEDFQSPSDYYSSPITATFSRIIRLFSVFISILLPAFFVEAELFHLQLIPLSFLLTIVNSIKGIPLSPSYEMLFTLLIFEILNEASVRMPKYVGMVVSIVGGLVLGETAVTAGIISAPTLMIIALSGICLYTVPELERSFSILRLIFLIIGGTLGGYGLLLSLGILLIYAVSFENFKTPLLAPFAPLVSSDLQDAVYKEFLLDNEFRPISLKNRNKRRLKKEKQNG